jgi:hypothetical protein
MSRQLSERNFGDGEIREISFLHPNVSLKIFNPTDSTFCTLLFRSVGVMLFETNHVQNVIDSIVLFDGLSTAMADESAAAFLKKVTPTDLANAAGSKFVHIRPITGGETIISFESFEIHE